MNEQTKPVYDFTELEQVFQAWQSKPVYDFTELTAAAATWSQS